MSTEAMVRDVTAFAVISVLFLAVGRGDEPASKLGREAMRVLVAARAECRSPGSKLRQLVARTFDADAFGKAEIDGWDALSEDQRREFARLADRVVGGEEREAGMRELCTAGRVRLDNEEGGVISIEIVPPENQPR
jgi:hypothetical protein